MYGSLRDILGGVEFLGLFCVCFLRKYRFMGLFTRFMGLMCENHVD